MATVRDILHPRSWPAQAPRRVRANAGKGRLDAAGGDGAAERARIAYRDVAIILFVGAAVGVYFGLTAEWQIAVESAQVVAGIVEYPADNPFYTYHVKSWTLLHQIPALLLKCGCGERALSVLMACVAGGVFLQALGLVAYAFCRDRLVACTVPLVYLSTNVCKGLGAVYPLFIVPEEYWTSYGVSGSACALFAWALWGLGLRRPSAFLAGVAPAIHPALGAWCILMIAVVLVLDWPREPGRLKSPLRWFAAGMMVAAASFAVQKYLSRGLPAVDTQLSRQLLAAFVEGWDNHRVPFPLDSVDFQFGWCLFALSSVVLAWFADKLPGESSLLLRILQLSTLASLALCLLTHLSAWLPLPLMAVMPGRFINFAVVVYPAALVGLLARLRRVWSIGYLLAGLSLYCLLRTLMLSKQLIYVPLAYKIFIASGLMLIYILASQQRAGKSAGLARLVRGAALLSLVLAGYLWMRDRHLAVLLWLAALSLWLARSQIARPMRLARKAEFAEGDTGRLGGRWRFAATQVSAPWRHALRVLVISSLWLAFFVKGGWAFGAGCLLIAAWVSPKLRASLCIGKTAQIDDRRRLVGSRVLLAGSAVGSEDGLPSPSYKTVTAWEGHPPGFSRGARSSLQPFRLAAIALGMTLVTFSLIERAKAGQPKLSAAVNDAVMAAARRESGMLLVVPRLCLVQLRTRRPVLLNGEAMNQITYVPESGPAMNRIVKAVYGDDILKPRPSWWQNWGGLMQYSGFDLWQTRTAAEWGRLGREFGFTQIVTGREWKLQLPVVAKSERLILYRVPPAD